MLLPSIEHIGNNHTTHRDRAMRLALYFNPNAGIQSLDADETADLLRADGDKVRTFFKEGGKGGIKGAIAWKPDVLVAAGGDATIARAATALWKRRSRIPLFILPLGTSNNIARSLGLTGDAAALARKLASARETLLDVGVASMDDDESPFIEAAGAGFIGEVLRRAEQREERRRSAGRRAEDGATKGEAQVRGAAAGIARQLRRARARQYRILAGDQDLSGQYVAVEAMNIDAIGPRIRLAPGAKSSDGALDLVLIRPEDREPLASFIESDREGDGPGLERHRVCRVQLRWGRGPGHLDDEVWPADKSGSRDVTIAVGGTVRLLLPKKTGGAA